MTHGGPLRLMRCVILGASVGLMLPGAWNHSITVVELALLPAGLAAWQSHDLGIYRVCGPVSKGFYALPAYLAGVRVEYLAEFDSDTNARQEWNLGKWFQIQHLQTCQAIYRWSRLFAILVTVLGGCLIYEWSIKLFGVWPGIVSLGVWCGMAPILAHGSLVTSDMPSAVLTLIAARTFWAFLMQPSAAAMLIAGGALGFAQATKYSLLSLTPCWALLLVCRALQMHGNRSERRNGTRNFESQSLFPTARLLALGLGILVASVFVIDVCYGFRGVGFSLSEWNSGRSSLARNVQELTKSPVTAWLTWIPLPIPIEFLRGLDVQLADTERIQSAYLLGQIRLGGWWYWYVVAALIKVPLPALVLFGMAIIRTPTALRSEDARFWAGLCILVPAVEIFLTISATTGTGTNAAFRYLLPSLGLLCIWIGLAGFDFVGSLEKGEQASGPCPREDSAIGVGGQGPVLFFPRPGAMIRWWSMLGILGWLLINAIVGIPDHLGWRNELGWVAERMTGKPVLIGDSLDWGQDLARLKEWVTRHSAAGSTCVCVYGFGIGEPYGLMPPSALSMSIGWKEATFIAVSDNILFGYDVGNSVSIGGNYSSLGPEQREALQRIEPFERVGRTIRIFRIRDLPPIDLSNLDVMK